MARMLCYSYYTYICFFHNLLIINNRPNVANLNDVRIWRLPIITFVWGWGEGGGAKVRYLPKSQLFGAQSQYLAKTEHMEVISCSGVVHTPAIPKTRGSNPSGGPLESRPLSECGCGSCVAIRQLNEWWSCVRSFGWDIKPGSRPCSIHTNAL